MIESQFGILTDRINSTQDFEMIKVLHEQFLTSLLSQTFVHMKSVSLIIYFMFYHSGYCSERNVLLLRCSVVRNIHLSTVGEGFVTIRK